MGWLITGLEVRRHRAVQLMFEPSRQLGALFSVSSTSLFGFFRINFARSSRLGFLRHATPVLGFRTNIRAPRRPSLELSRMSSKSLSANCWLTQLNQNSERSVASGLPLDIFSSQKISGVACGSGTRSDPELPFFIEGQRSFSSNW